MARVLGILLLASVCVAQDSSTEEYQKALRLLQKKKWRAGQKALRRFIEKYPESPHVSDAAIRSDDNCYFGTEVLWKSGPAERRIDVAVMGDGFPHDASAQKKQETWAKYCVDVLWNEKGFSQYRSYFNIYFVRLCSLEEGVDPQLTPEQRKKIEERNRTRSKSRQKKTDYSTALDAKSAGPQGQVMMSRRLAYKWLDIADKDTPGVGHDRYIIAFAQFGKLGMAGGGMANVGRPDKSVTTHEFGHAFSRLLDEYANNPGAPRGMWGRALRAANAHVSPTEPKKSEVPWAHMLRKFVKGVGIYEGGATFKKGVWRPARSCAMNAAGNNQFCPVCREQTILVIYEYVNPIDAADPKPGPVETTEGEAKFLTVTPMEPYKHKLDVSWYVVDHVVTDAGKGGFEIVEEQPPDVGMTPRRPLFAFGGSRARGDRGHYANPPSGKKVNWAKRVKGRGKGAKRVPGKSVFPLAKLAVGTWRVTCQVEDRTKWVIKDDKHLLKERVSWIVTVKPEAQASAE
ncbi:MAG: M64 family metallopeptidase [Planctomycetota bacterium]|jgi:hypothetical protein